MKLYN